MKRFWIDYSNSILVEAETAEEAENKFWENNSDNEIAVDFGEIKIDCVEEEEDEEVED